MNRMNVSFLMLGNLSIGKWLDLCSSFGHQHWLYSGEDDGKYFFRIGIPGCLLQFDECILGAFDWV